MKHLYVHVPFCREICAYCDFFRVRCHDGLIGQWLAALKQELEGYRHYASQPIDTVYIGGGTPSALNDEQLKELMILLESFARSCQEYTVEANPESLTREKIEILKRYGVNRISLGVQTLDREILKLIHRRHDPEMVKSVITQLHEAGLHNISIDMMYGLPKQTAEMWVSHLAEVASWPITHISIYALTIEEHSEFGRKHQELIDNELEGEMYERGVETLQRHGFEQYEVSNFARDGLVSRHNMGYWLVEDYVGAGPGAHGSLGELRYENTGNLQEYFKGNFIQETSFISVKERMFETVMLGLRMNQGISLAEFKHRFHVGIEDVYGNAICKQTEAGMLVIENGYLKTTKNGMQFLHTVLLDFMNESDGTEGIS